MNYQEYIIKKTHSDNNFGFSPIYMPDFLFDFQKHLVDWALVKGRAGKFADCGLGKSPMALVWAENIVRKTNGKILIATPLAVSYQMIKEGEKFGIECKRSRDGKPNGKITVTNYEQLDKFNPNDYVGFIGDEASCLKNFNGVTKKIVTNFCRKIQYRLLCTATAAPNDYTELGTLSEALGNLGYMDMLSRFFKNTQNTCDTKAHWRAHGNGPNKWRFKGHARKPFWRWVCSWAKVIRKPSDLGYEDGNFILPELIEEETVVEHSRPLNGKLYQEPAVGLHEQRQERRATIQQRCEEAARKVDHKEAAVVWCHLNDEADLLEKIIPDAKQISGSMSDEKKEERFIAFQEGQLKKLVIKPKIGAFGLNWQHCNHTVTFPSHSFEQFYQQVRRFWRFGQKKPVKVDIITSEGEISVLKNLRRKAKATDLMFNELLREMNDSENITNYKEYTKDEEIPEWL